MSHLLFFGQIRMSSAVATLQMMKRCFVGDDFPCSFDAIDISSCGWVDVKTD